MLPSVVYSTAPLLFVIAVPFTFTAAIVPPAISALKLTFSGCPIATFSLLSVNTVSPFFTVNPLTTIAVPFCCTSPSLLISYTSFPFVAVYIISETYSPSS